MVVFAVLLTAGSGWMRVKLKALKCFLEKPEKGSIELCYVKAISREISTFNLIGNLNGSYSSPILVSFSCENSFRSIKLFLSLQSSFTTDTEPFFVKS